MRRVDRMTKEEIIEFFITDCDECEAKNICIGARCDYVKKQYLTAEIPMKSRWELCKTDADFEKMVKEARSICNSHALCKDCEFHEKCGPYVDIDCAFTCVIVYGTEKVEVE